ncbi:streptophobe family protein [Streptomyces albireticuli]|uniref:streptophobe family protein n=1 Tax=Streptomyces albireticuli TaxID=1940 RepID=UPI001E4BC1C3|nr:streptophobe family protein [Streptomyces albireticuli]MCD9194276.1 streptophobe family protein [Streptomyces albireticuli]
MSQPPSAAPEPPRHALRAWWDAFAAVAAGVAALFVTAALGLWAAGATGLPGGFPAVVAATVVAAVGGTVELSGGAGFLGSTAAGLDVVPLSVTLAGAVVTAEVFLRPLRHRAVASGRELLARVARTALLWLVALLLICLAARHTFRVDLGGTEVGDLGDLGDLGDIGDALGVTPEVGFRAAVGPTVTLGLMWLLVLLAVAVAVSRRTPLPSRLLRFQEPVRPAAFAMLAVLLSYVVLGLVAGVVVLLVRGHPAETAAVLLLGLPNLAWLAFGVGLGGTWDGRAPDIGLPVPKALAAVLRERDGKGAVNLSSLAQQDGRAWLLLVVAALALLAAGLLMAVRSSPRTRSWQHGARLAVALAVTLLVIAALTGITARFGLSLLGIGDLGAFGGEVSLRPRWLPLLGLGLLWGLIAGFLGGVLARRVRRRGDMAEVTEGAREP